MAIACEDNLAAAVTWRPRPVGGITGRFADELGRAEAAPESLELPGGSACMAAGHTITIIPAGCHVEVSVGGQKLAESDRAMRLDETGLPARYYIPRQDVRTEVLRPVRRKTTCPFKGQASYWSAQVGGELYKDLVWSYQTPIPAAQQIAGLMCFYNERVELTISDRHRQDPRASSLR
jgi:uncharacterized protein (DUF427 family)